MNTFRLLREAAAEDRQYAFDRARAKEREALIAALQPAARIAEQMIANGYDDDRGTVEALHVAMDELGVFSAPQPPRG